MIHALLTLSLLFIPSSLAAPTRSPPPPNPRPLARLSSSLTDHQLLPGLGWGCPDEHNSVTYWEIRDWKLERLCVCLGRYQFFDISTNQCSCPADYVQSHSSSGVLSCTPSYISTSPLQPHAQALDFMSRKKKGSTRETEKYGHNGITTAEPEGSYEGNCGLGERVCQIEGRPVCVDVMNDLTACGGCPDEKAFVDCGALTGISTAQCIAGTCRIDSCRRGYTLEEDPYPETSTHATCVAKQKMPWFGYQTSP